VKTARELGCALIIVLTESGNTARLVAKYFPTVPVISLTDNPSIARQMSGYIKSVYAEVAHSLTNFDEVLSVTLTNAKSKGLCKVGDNVVIIKGSTDSFKAGDTNLVCIHTVQ